MFQFTHFGHVEYTDNVPVNKKKHPAGQQDIKKLPCWLVYGIKMLARMGVKRK
ncbi:MAG: hypothetical protein J6X65_07525 [Bacteroidales bacterium]|nr:hypothetical protein [Bacteroidales bacterium]